MQAYEKAMFVEDMARNVAVRLQADYRVAWFKVKVLNQESIHSHNAYALIEWRRRKCPA
jgi:GTP cyclohydrolase I